MERSIMTVTVLDRAPDSPDAVLVGEADGGLERPDPEVPERARRRSFTAKYKLKILTAYEAAAEGEKGALLRREGLYSSHMVAWRRARDAGALAGLASPRGRRRPDAKDTQIARLSKEKSRLEQELAKARFVVDVQAKLSALLEKLSEGADTETRSPK
jgi:transposase